MVMLEDAPADYFIAPHLLRNAKFTEIVTQGWKLRSQLPSYLEQQRASVVTHCPLPHRAAAPRCQLRHGHSGGHVDGHCRLRVKAPRAKI
jgi:hypothetical protein